MKKTYFAPEFVTVKIATSQMLAASTLSTTINTNETVEQGSQMSNSFAGGLWDEEEE